VFLELIELLKLATVFLESKPNVGHKICTAHVLTFAFFEKKVNIFKFVGGWSENTFFLIGDSCIVINAYIRCFVPYIGQL
jgi:hypothetical protein